MLRTALGEHADIVSLTEMFNPDLNKGAPFDDDTAACEILEHHIFRPYPPSIGAVGFALHRSGARFGNWPDLWRLLIEDEDLHVISLRRQNLLRRYLSWRAMVEPKSDPAEPKVMSQEELRAEFEAREAEWLEFERAFCRHPTLDVTYEQLCTSYEATMRRVQTFLGVRPLDLQPTTERNRHASLRTAIANFNELASAFEDTAWAPLFGQGPVLFARATVDVVSPTI